MRVWERGAGVTLACGTGACAALVAGVLTGRCESHATIELPGGPLEITWARLEQSVLMTGPAERVFTGRLTQPSYPSTGQIFPMILEGHYLFL